MNECASLAEQPEAKVRVFVASPVRLYQEGLAYVLSRRDGFELVGMARYGDDLLGCVTQLCPHVTLLDLSLPHSLALAQAISLAVPDVKIVALGLTEAADEVLKCAEAGIAGYLTREGSVDDLVDTIHSVMRGELPCSPRIAAILLRRVSELAAHAPSPHRTPANLTLRERQIVELIDQGLSNREIACRLSIHLPTVKNHVHHILEKLMVRRRGEAAARVRSVAGANRGWARHQ